MNLAVCNTVVPSTDPITQEIQYQVRAAARAHALRSPSAGSSLPDLNRRLRHSSIRPRCRSCSCLLACIPPTRQASSPDEEALVQGAAYLGYRLVSRTTEAVTVSWGGRLWNYDVLAVLEFNSDR